MIRFLGSLLVAALVGLAFGLYLGWVQFPVQTIDSPANLLAQRYKDDYTIMIAAGYARDGDVTGALERMRVLRIDDVPAYVQEVTERFITNSRSIDDIRLLVALSEGLGRLTPLMEPYRQVTLPGQGR
ncbi:MAG: hypothetical protein SNJ59_16260 [Aggregatilineales bacterium]